MKSIKRVGQALIDLGYEIGEGNGQYIVAPFGVTYNYDPNYGYGAINFGYEEVCAMKKSMEELQ